MTLEIMKGVEEIRGFKVIVMDELREKFPDKFLLSGQMNWEWFEKEIRPNHFIYIREDVNSLSFTMQNGSVKENGVNGCQIDTIIAAVKLILERLEEKSPCSRNRKAVIHLEDALAELEERRYDRESRGVEGASHV